VIAEHAAGPADYFGGTALWYLVIPIVAIAIDVAGRPPGAVL
jgi:hypothetical protein